MITTTDRAPVSVLHVLEATLGGTMRYVENIAEATRGLNLVCGFAYGTSRADSKLPPFLDLVKGLGWPLFPIDMRREINVAKDFANLRRLRQAVREFSPDILHCHSSKAGALGRAAIVGLPDKPVCFYSPHAIAVPLGSRYLRIEKLLARRTDRFIAVSESERHQIADLGVTSYDKVDVVYPTIDFEFFTPASKAEARQILKLGANPLVVAIGRISPQKSPETFLGIMKRLWKQNQEVTGIWVGSGEGEQEFRVRIAAAGLSDCVFIVPWMHDVRRYIAAADVVLSTSKFESFGYVSAEALAMQRPVVASDVTGTCDIMSAEMKQWLYRFGDEDGAASLVTRLFKNPTEAEEVAAMGRNQVMKFSMARMRMALGEAYVRGLNEANPKARRAGSRLLIPPPP